MFAYCGNNPVMYSDPSGEFFLAAIVTAAVVITTAVVTSGCSSKSSKSGYKSADAAAKAFSEQVYSSSMYIRHEYATEIYSQTTNGTTTYNYNQPRAGEPHSVSISNSSPEGTKIVAYAHTDPSSNLFSGPDIKASIESNIDGYVVGPNRQLKRYTVSSSSGTNLGVISPVALTDEQRQSLVKEFKVSWDNHILLGCDLGCDNIEWPTP